jgi:uncharacterized protein (TIGR03663 family)
MNRRLAAFGLALLAVAILALGLRLPDLGRRPLHNDEAVNAILLRDLAEQGRYRYNPDEFHGPTLYYASLPFIRVFGAPGFDRLDDGALRWVTVAAGVALIALLPWLHDALGRRATLVAATLLAVSPAMVFYSRYFIHEMPLVFFTLFSLAAAWRYQVTRRPSWALLIGLGLGLMHATKETFVLTVASMAVGLGAEWWRGRDGSAPRDSGSPYRPNPWHVALAAGAGLAVSTLLFSSFLAHPRGIVDSVATYLPWLKRAGGQTAHVHPWYFHLQRLFWFQVGKGPFWSESLIGGLAMYGGWRAWAGRGLSGASPGFVRFLTAYTGSCAGVYAVISYKTPWCLLNFLLPMILVAGVGAVALWDRFPGGVQRVVLSVLLLAGGGHLGAQAWRAGREASVQQGHPYIYSQTVPNALELAERVKAIAAVSPDGAGTRVRVVAPESEYWPLPWYLRQLKNVWWHDSLPEDPYAPIIIVAAKLRAGLDDRSNRRYLSVGYYELRPREFFELYVEFELWKRFVPTLPRPKDDE